ncbi:hypothetical protein TVAG_094500 [Trichomonas vaginalis G3]|uniref:Uncharacterized protein n=1 Tax=Trichomonas vaginalis (strain ATCC PRA-98 / G3) TaxID=412133 RepID=A2DBS2_TRIV3|nr:NCK-associateD protein 1 family [Trichomonas vaginalis G3]EAY22275.1 hypothetical protein TVAG_094500 [Trichomonas vaginalis G3]KAI5533255.1 NCK-associateD protein 1 family [Trichomonas vaginalis G3]|eukprot:XP_001583261.1 hypothetical protein [Trichomonas vaginalis G3]
MSHEELKEFKIDQAYALDAHADHLLASLYSVKKALTEYEADFFNSKVNSQIIDTIKRGKSVNDPKFQIGNDKIMRIGQTLRQSYLTICHFQKFQNNCLHTLLDAQDASRSFALQWNSEFIIPLIKIFVKYIKLHIMISQIKNIKNVPILYYFCKNSVERDDWNSQILELYKYLEGRTSYTILEAELQPLVKRYEEVCHSIKSHIHTILTSDASTNWSFYSLLENPSTAPSRNHFMHLEYFVGLNMELFSDFLVCFFLVNVPAVSEFADVFSDLCAIRPHLPLIADISVPVSSIFDALHKSRTKKEDLSSSFFDKAAAQAYADKDKALYRIKKLESLIREYCLAGTADINALCMKMPIFLSLLGQGYFFVTTDLMKSRTDQNIPLQDYIVSLLSQIILSFFLVLKNQKQIKRFFIYNLREYDYPYLLSNVTLLRLEKQLYDKVTFLAHSLETLDMDAFDKGDGFDTLPLTFVVASIQSSFNKYSTNHGVVHLPPLFQLLADVSLHAKLTNSPLMTLFEFAPIYKFWCFKNILKNHLIFRSTSQSSIVISLCGLAHFYSYDTAIAAEHQVFFRKIPKYYGTMEKAVSTMVTNWIQQQWLLQTSQKSPKTSRQGEKRMTDSLQILLDIGTINVLDQKINLLQRIIPVVKDGIPAILEKQKFIPPATLLEHLNGMRDFLISPLIGVGINPYTVFNDNINEITSVLLSYDMGIVEIEGKMGRAMNLFYDTYKKYLMEDITSAYYSPVLRAFVDGTSKPKISAPTILSIPALRALVQILNKDGMIAMSSMFAQCAIEVLTKTATLFDEIKSNADESFDACSSLIHASSILMARRMLHEVNNSLTDNQLNDNEFQQRLNTSLIMPAFDSSSILETFTQICSCSFWNNLVFDANTGGFTNDAHLIPVVLDAVYGSLIAKQPNYDLYNKYKSLLKAMINGIKMIKKDDKKLLMYILIDFCVKDSIYADYSMTTDALPYQLIRSVYSGILQIQNQ